MITKQPVSLEDYTRPLLDVTSEKTRKVVQTSSGIRRGNPRQVEIEPVLSFYTKTHHSLPASTTAPFCSRTVRHALISLCDLTNLYNR